MRALLAPLLWLWLLAGLGLGGLFQRTPYAALAGAATQPNYAAEFAAAPLALTPARYEALRLGCWLVAAGAAGGLLAGGVAKRRRANRDANRLKGAKPAPFGGAPYLTAWRRLRPGQRRVALGLGGLALLLRGWLALATPITTDELTSYDYYVQPGAATAASVYTLPNNHLLYNLLAAGAAQLPLPPDAAQRLPAVLVGLVLLPLAYLGLLRYLRYGAATLALALFTFSPTPAFYAIAGRGYGVQLAAALAGFFATLALLRTRGQSRRAWAGWLVSGVAGLYAVPTHLYVLGPLGLALLLGLGWLPALARWPALGRLALAAVGVLATTALLYAPVGAVTGWQPLLHNPYVRSLSLREFGQGLGAYLPEMATRLWGQGGLTLGWLAALAVLAPLVLRRVGPAGRRVGWLSYALTFGPLAMLVGQRVYVPGRALLPAMLFSLVLLALVVQAGVGWGLARQPTRLARAVRRYYPLALAGLVLAYAGYRFGREAAGLRTLAARHAQLRRQHGWLAARRPARVWLDSLSRPYQGIYWHHLAVTGQPTLPLAVAAPLPTAAAGPAEYAVFDREHGGRVPPALAGQLPAYADSTVYIWRLVNGRDSTVAVTGGAATRR